MSKNQMIAIIIAAIAIVAAIAAAVVLTSGNGSKDVSVTNVSLDKTSMSLVVGNTGTLVATVSPSDATNKNVNWTTSNSSVATVSNGTVTAKSAGSATITVTTDDGAKTAKCSVTVTASTVAVTGITLDNPTLEIETGSTATLVATVSPSTATNKNVTWSSTNPSVATVSNGTVTGVSAGTASIVATTADGSRTAVCTITVSKSTAESDSEYYKNGITIKNAVPSTTTPNTFTIYEKPQRVVCLFQGNVELMCMFNLQDSIVGAYVRGENMVCNNPEYQERYDSVDVTVGATNTWSREQIMAWEPDLIIGWTSSFSDSMIGTIASWNELGVNCYRTNLYGNSNGTSVDTYYQMLRDIGAIFNKNDEANQAISDWNKIIKDNEQKLAEANITEKKKILVIDYKSDTSGGTTLVYGTSMLTGNLVEMAGGKCISSGRMDSYTFEEIANMDFDVVLIVALGYYTSLTQEEHDKVVSFFTDMPVWSHFKEEKPDLIVETLPFYTLYMAGILDNDCLSEIFKMIYPELS